MVIILVIIILIVTFLVIVITIDVHHPDQPAGPDRVTGTDVLTNNHILSLKATCVMITDDDLFSLEAARDDH